MKAELSNGVKALKGTIGNNSAQMRLSGCSFGKKPIPYSKSGAERSTAQRTNESIYKEALQDFKAATVEDLTRWFNEAQAYSLSAWNMLLKIAIGSKYNEGEYDFSHYS